MTSAGPSMNTSIKGNDDKNDLSTSQENFTKMMDMETKLPVHLGHPQHTGYGSSHPALHGGSHGGSHSPGSHGGHMGHSGHPVHSGLSRPQHVQSTGQTYAPFPSSSLHYATYCQGNPYNMAKSP